MLMRLVFFDLFPKLTYRTRDGLLGLEKLDDNVFVTN